MIFNLCLMRNSLQSLKKNKGTGPGSRSLKMELIQEVLPVSSGSTDCPSFSRNDFANNHSCYRRRIIQVVH